ncbi:Autoinducer prepeptide [[Clostridium] sordellii]|nr:cyclic lactone autoinducer peptide [Paeniclostridium sordellii]CEK36648.1 Autoinducer prepeptide,cyclic lactone autoinducer peptide (plasmid) [[Clostridium] sordellii] [Paeniclostridium sordellii]CEP46145.1 Autoinducer prepeptide [[Clostridium] sordellii] [Paeniclostridium sordellii]
MKKIIFKLMKVMAATSLSIAALSTNTVSNWIIYQPEIPKELYKLKK